MAFAMRINFVDVVCDDSMKIIEDIFFLLLMNLV